MVRRLPEQRAGRAYRRMQPSAAVLELGKGRHQRELARDAAAEGGRAAGAPPGPERRSARGRPCSSPTGRAAAQPLHARAPAWVRRTHRADRVGGQPGLADWKDVRYERRPRTLLEPAASAPARVRMSATTTPGSICRMPSGLRRGSDRGGIRLERALAGREDLVLAPARSASSARRVLASGSTSRGGRPWPRASSRPRAIAGNAWPGSPKAARRTRSRARAPETRRSGDLG